MNTFNTFLINIHFPTDTEPAWIESSDPHLRPKELAWVFDRLGIKNFSNRSTIRQRQRGDENPIDFDKRGRYIYYPLENVNKYLRERWEKEQREKNKIAYR